MLRTVIRNRIIINGIYKNGMPKLVRRDCHIKSNEKKLDIFQDRRRPENIFLFGCLFVGGFIMGRFITDRNITIHYLDNELEKTEHKNREYAEKIQELEKIMKEMNFNETKYKEKIQELEKIMKEINLNQMETKYKERIQELEKRISN